MNISVRAAYCVAAVFFVTLCISCSNFLLRDPRLYNTNNGQSSAGSDLPALELPTSPEALSVFASGQWSSSEGNGFSASQFNSWLLKVSFDANNVPEYEFFTPSGSDTRAWRSGTLTSAEYLFDAGRDNNTAQGGFRINPMTVYQYRGKNPLVQSSSAYNKAPQLERFYFYRFSGKALVVELDNYLAAVDTYSKFLFAYGKITSYTSAVGQYIPKKYQAVELFAEERPFYEYDPIGYVNEDGSVILYQEYYTEMISGEHGAVDFFPYIKDPERETAGYNPDSPGCSPYLIK